MTVNNVNALLNYTAGQTDPAGMKQDGLAQDSFNQVMAKVSDTISSLRTEAAGNAVNTSAAVQTTGVAATAKTETAASKDAATQETSKKAETDSGKAGDAAGQKDNDKIAEASGTDKQTDQTAEEIEETAKELVQEIAKEMDVTPEEVEEAMAVLGLTAVQLFDTDNLKQLLLQITGSTDELSLVTDEALYGNLQNLLGAVEESLGSLAEELGMTEDEVNALMEQMIADAGETEAAEAEDVPKVNLEGMKDYTVSVQKDGKTVQVKVTVDDASGNKSVQEEVTDAPKTEVQAGHRTRERNASADSGKGDGSHAGNAFLQTLDKAMETGETPEPVNVEYRSMQTEDIMNQIMDYMKINLKAESQEMELQLHPASLGTVGVQIAAKDGVITAHFTTQNEAVRAVIETQLIQLKNQFEEQGIKVDAVEVTVANHAYGQQFSQEHENTDGKQGKAQKSTRRINLDELGEEAELDEMEDSERIAVEMMQANGSTVDYTA
ncbi:MAG: hypothetical protein HDR09_19345 [Lachnospiraceae bacterium]|nr:hypothetical protein [Lachnospiraceae bacterium]